MPFPLVHAPVGTVLIRQGIQSFVLALALRDGDAPLPITDMQCWVCEQDVDVLEEGTAGPRVLGDSRFGYEAMHLACR